MVSIPRFLTAACVLLVFGVPARGQQCHPALPRPSLRAVGVEDNSAGGQAWTRLMLNVTNSSAFPDELFAPAPTLPPCGVNNNSARTWVEIFDNLNNYLSGFCGLRGSGDLNSIWFAVPRGTALPTSISVRMTDRLCGLTYTSGQTTLAPEPPTELRTSSIAGSLVSLRWAGPQAGPVPTGYAVEGGVSPGQVLGSLQSGSANPLFTFDAPTGAYYIRLHSLFGSQRSAASNEIRIFVNTPAAPSPPTNLLGLVDGSSLALAWMNTYAGGAPTSLMLDVAGSITTSLRLGLADSLAFSGVPGGTYTLALRAINAAGTSPQSSTVTVTFPGPCAGPPSMPAGLLAHRVGRTVLVEWSLPAGGPAPTSYTLHVTGAFVGSLTTTSRALSGTVGPGSYTLSVAAANACGTSPVTTAQTVTVP